MAINISLCEDTNIIFPLIENLFREIIPGFEAFKAQEKENFLTAKQQGQIKHQAFIAYNEEGQPIGCMTIAGSLSLFARGEYGIINELWVQPEYRSQGVGLQLLQTGFDFATRSCWKRLDIAAPIDEKWGRTVSFYERNGFAQCGVKLRRWL